MLCWSTHSGAAAGGQLIRQGGCGSRTEVVIARPRSLSGHAWECKVLASWEGLGATPSSKRLPEGSRNPRISRCTDISSLQPPKQGRYFLDPVGLNLRNLPATCKRNTVACRARSAVKTTGVARKPSSTRASQKGLNPEIKVDQSSKSSSESGGKDNEEVDGRSSDRPTLISRTVQRGLSDGEVSDGAALSRKASKKGRSISTSLDSTDRVPDEKAVTSGASDVAKEGVSKPSLIAGVPGRTLLERGTRLIKTTPKESRWGDTHPEGFLPAQGTESSSQSSPPPRSLDAIFSPTSRGRPKPRFRREPQSEGASDKQSGGSPVSAASSTLARPTRERFTETDFGLHPSSGFLAGYDFDDDVAVPIINAFPPSLGPSTEWVVETCPKCSGSAVVACDVCHASWSPGTCPKCKGKGYMACTNCKGSGTVYGPAKRAQPVKAQPPKPSVQSSGGESEEGPSLIEAFRIIKNERRSRSAVSTGDHESGEDGVPQKPHWLKGRPITEEHKRKISLALQGRPRPPLTHAHKKKLSDIRREFFEQPGAKERWSETAKRRRVMHCSICGLPGHSSRWCPEAGFVKHASKPCPICGQPGHTRHGCPKRPNVSIPYRCKTCGEYGHERVNCPNEPAFQGLTLCELCGVPGHRNRECPQRPKELILQRCSVCQQAGHNKQRCPERLRKG